MTQEILVDNETWDITGIVLGYAELRMDNNPELDRLMMAYHEAQRAVEFEAQQQVSMPFEGRWVKCAYEESAMGRAVTDPEQIAFWKSKPSNFIKVRDDLEEQYSNLCRKMNQAKREIYDYVASHLNLVNLTPRV